jgi:hypothetical protein
VQTITGLVLRVLGDALTIGLLFFAWWVLYLALLFMGGIALSAIGRIPG